MNQFDKFFEGYELEAYNLFGSHIKDGGMEFCLWAPHAFKVEVFTSKDNFSNLYPLQKIDDRGVWYTYIENMEPIYSYRYRIYKNEFVYIDKSDPFSYMYERRPSNASVMYNLDYFKFDDYDYMCNRKVTYDQPINIYEVHINGFMKDDKYELNSYQHLKENLIPYVSKMGYTHIELLPVFEHPFDGSWGYQSYGFYAATSRYGTPYDLMDFINECHKNNIGVILDVVYLHFAKDSFALSNFDFEPLYEYQEKHLANSQWGTYCFNLSSNPVNSFLMSSANFFAEKYHFDGFRFDAISNFIYHDGNKDKGENVGGQSFVKRINFHLKSRHPSIMLIAEDSSDYPYVTKPVEYGGLGFDYKWDLGWMNDTLKYYALDPIYRKYHHNLINFSMAYFFNERFMLPFSHDEVVHMKKTIIDKMWGTYEEKFAQCRNLFMYMFFHPGKKLNFMGNDIASFREFDERRQLDWNIMSYPIHDAFKRYFRDLSNIYKSYSALFTGEYDYNHFKWIDADNYEQSIYSFYRYDDEYCFVTILNMLPVSYTNYEIGVPFSGEYVELINSEKDIYNGCNMCNYEPIKSYKANRNNMENVIKISIAPYAGITFIVRYKNQAFDEFKETNIISNKNIEIGTMAKGEE